MEKQIYIERVTDNDYKKIMRYFYKITNSSNFTIEKKINDLYNTKGVSLRNKVAPKTINDNDEDEEDNDEDETDNLIDVKDSFLYKSILYSLSLSTSLEIKQTYLYYICSHPKYRIHFDSLELDTNTTLPMINKLNEEINTSFLPKLQEHFQDNTTLVNQELEEITKKYVDDKEKDVFKNRIMVIMTSENKIDFTSAYRKYHAKDGKTLLIDSTTIDDLRNEINKLKKTFVKKTTREDLRNDISTFLGITVKKYYDDIDFFETKTNIEGIIKKINEE